MLIRLLACAAMAAARLAELRRSRANLQLAAPVREGEWSRRTYPLMVALHAIVIGGTLMRGSDLPRGRWLALLCAVQPLRAWVLAVLGARWNTRGAVSPALIVETRGPYALVRHPNYAVVFVELLALPLAFRLPRLAVAGLLANALLLAVRVREEEAALMHVPGYAEHFARLPRFIPGVW